MKILILIISLLFTINTQADTIDQSIWVLAGKTALNGGTAPKQFVRAFQVEQDTLNWYIGYLNEGNIYGNKRDGLFAMRRVTSHLTPRLETSIAAGPYLAATTVEGVPSTTFHYTYSASIITAISIKYRLTEGLSVQTRYQHVVVSSDHRDTDQFITGFGLEF
jgi:hypothetical protein